LWSAAARRRFLGRAARTALKHCERSVYRHFGLPLLFVVILSAATALSSIHAWRKSQIALTNLSFLVDMRTILTYIQKIILLFKGGEKADHD
jgi:hypothetical protein